MNFKRTAGRRSTRLMVLFAAFLFIVSAAGEEPLVITIPQAPLKTSLWAVRSGGTTLYLAGSIHFLRQEDHPLPLAMREAYADSDKVFFETDIGAMSDPNLQAKMLRLSMYPQEENLYGRISAETLRLYEKKMEQLGLPAEQFARFKPWFIAMSLELMEFQRLGFDPNYGVDTHFYRLAREDGKPTGFFETVDQQIDLLAGMDRKNQDDFLNQTLRDIEQISGMAEELVSSWRTGDAVNLHLMLFRNFDDYPGIYERLLLERNRDWVRQIEELLNARQTVMVVVGVMHLVGPESVVAILEQKGYAVDQL
jgi:uncharacterized protein YbaP (TraB family)